MRLQPREQALKAAEEAGVSASRLEAEAKRIGDAAARQAAGGGGKRRSLFKARKRQRSSDLTTGVIERREARQEPSE